MLNKDVVSYMKLTHEFRGIRVLDNKLNPVKWSFTASFAGADLQDVDMEEHKKQLTISYQKISLWLEHFFDDIYLVSINDLAAISSFCELGYENTLVQVPALPTDDVLIETLNKKIATLAGEYLVIGECELHGDDTQTTYCFHDLNGNSSMLPEQKDWVNIEEVVYDKPWWLRPDCDTWEPAMLEGHTREEMLEQVSTEDILDSIVHDLEIALGVTEEDDDNDEDAEIVELSSETWKPKTV